MSTHLDPEEADVLRRALESGYRHARDAAGQAWSTSERSARMGLAAELMTLAFAEQPQTTTGAAPAWTGRRCPRHAAADRTVRPRSNWRQVNEYPQRAVRIRLLLRAMAARVIPAEPSATIQLFRAAPFSICPASIHAAALDGPRR